MKKQRIAFLGLGTMGSGMAHRLLAAGFPLNVFNRRAEKARPLVAAGAQGARSPREAVAGCDVVISMLSDDPASRAVWLGPDGALAGVTPGAICIECSTVTVDWARELAATAKAKACNFLDAPVTGSKLQAAAGELNFLVGGQAEIFENVRQVLAAMGKSATLIGPEGAGALLKLINNFICGVEIAALAEAFALIERSGLERAKALEVIANGSPGSPLVKAVSARMAATDYTPNFMLHLMAKDLGYAIREGEKNGVKLETAVTALARFEQAKAAGLGDKDLSAVVEPLRKK